MCVVLCCYRSRLHFAARCFGAGVKLAFGLVASQNCFATPNFPDIVEFQTKGKRVKDSGLDTKCGYMVRVCFRYVVWPALRLRRLVAFHK